MDTAKKNASGRISARVKIRTGNAAGPTWQCRPSPLLGHMPLYHGFGAMEALKEILEKASPDKVFVLSDQRIFKLYGGYLLQLLADALPKASNRMTPETILLSEGETEKTWSNLEFLCEELFERGITKSSLILNFGGGVILNIGGMAASLIYRGVRFVQIPTTLMAQSDVVVSNKQGINFAGGKNRLGTFHVPLAAVADPRFLATEPRRQLRAAMVEYCKNALLLGGSHYDEALEHFGRGDLYSEEQLGRLIECSLDQKFFIAEADPTEKAAGLMLEYGHTVGHALEYLSQGRLLHGEAVYHGMNVAGMLSEKMGYMPAQELMRQSLLLSHLAEMPTIPADISVGQVLNCVQRDNKKVGADIAFILVEGIGKVRRNGDTVLTPVTETQLKEALIEYWDALL